MNVAFREYGDTYFQQPGMFRGVQPAERFPSVSRAASEAGAPVDPIEAPTTNRPPGINAIVAFVQNELN